MPRHSDVAHRIDAAVRAALPALLSAVFFAVPVLATAADSSAAATPANAPAPASAEERQQRVEGLARREGYRRMDRDGQRLYCKEEEMTGSRVRRQRTCYTEDQLELELDLQKDTAREVLDKGLRGFTPNTP